MLSEARLLQEELSRACERQYWNLAVRRAQEVVELSLKGLLRALGTEYPRLHDVGDAFAEAVAAKNLSIDPQALGRIREISSYLARDRAPAFYMEQEFTQEQAERAQADARFVLDFADGLAEQFKQRSDTESGGDRRAQTP